MTGWRRYAAVGLGSGLGSLLRHLLSLHGLALPGGLFPWATLAVNGLGSWLIAAVAGYAAQRAGGWLTRWQPFLMAGFCGGFTTFSLFGAETWLLIAAGRPVLALTYGVASALLWFTAAWLGYRVGQRAARSRG